MIPRRLDPQTNQLAVQFATDSLSGAGYSVEPAPLGLMADLLVHRSRQSSLVKVLSAAAPHRRGGGASLGLHWLLADTAADLVMLVDLSRSRSWLLPVPDFRRLAKPFAGGRYHLDWIVMDLGRRRSAVAGESDFEAFRFGSDSSLLI